MPFLLRYVFVSDAVRSGGWREKGEGMKWIEREENVRVHGALFSVVAVSTA